MYDVIVAGVGGMGSAVCWQLARQGKRVLGLERFDIPHVMGSSHGVTRVIRLPYYEDPAYVPLLHRAYALWREAERASGERLLIITGSLDGGLADGVVFDGALLSARTHGLAHEVLDGAAVRARYPAYAVPPESRFVFQPEGGFIASERAIVTHVRLALEAGAEIHAREQVTAWESNGDRVTVTTHKGRYEASSLVLAAGAWMGTLMPELAPLAVPERQVLAWLQPSAPALFTPEAFPVFNMEVEEGRYYGLPVYEVPGFKFGRFHHREESGAPEALRHEPDDADEALLRAFAARYFPEGNGPTMALRACLFTNTPDEHFVIDCHPRHGNVVVASPCSGHGYKFCSVVGEIVAALATNRPPPCDIDFLRLSRLT